MTNPMVEYLNALLLKRGRNCRIVEHPTDGSPRILDTQTGEVGDWTPENCRKLLSDGEDPTLPNLDAFESREPKYKSLPPDLYYGPPEHPHIEAPSSVMNYGDKRLRLTCAGGVVWADMCLPLGNPRLGREIKTTDE